MMRISKEQFLKPVLGSTGSPCLIPWEPAQKTIEKFIKKRTHVKEQKLNEFQEDLLLQLYSKLIYGKLALEIKTT